MEKRRVKEQDGEEKKVLKEQDGEEKGLRLRPDKKNI